MQQPIYVLYLRLLRSIITDAKRRVMNLALFLRENYVEIMDFASTLRFSSN
jgi:hypothetical protein